MPGMLVGTTNASHHCSLVPAELITLEVIWVPVNLLSEGKLTVTLLQIVMYGVQKI